MALKVLSPTAILGYGFPEESFMNGIKMSPDVISVDAGSSDPGPYYLGVGKAFTDRTGVKRDLRYMLKEGVKRKIPVIIGTAGGSGAKPHLKWCEEIIREIAREEKLSFKMGIIPSDVEKKEVISALKKGKIKSLQYVPHLTEKTIEESLNIVAQIGYEPIIKALEKKCDVVLCGRAYDPAVFSALPIMKGYSPGLATHMGKILECAAIAATPGSGADAVLGTIYEDRFVLETLSNKRKFTKESTAAHSLYEKSDPYFLHGPGGILNLTGTSFKEIPPNKVEVRGSKFERGEKYFVKLEAARKVGYRTVSIAGVRDPILIKSINKTIEEVQKRVEDILKNENIKGKALFHLYGVNGVMGADEPVKNTTSHEICVVIEAVSDTQEKANTICSITRSTLLHYGYPGRISTAGNLAFPFSPSDIKAGEVFEFSIYHLMEIEDPAMFETRVVNI